MTATCPKGQHPYPESRKVVLKPGRGQGWYYMCRLCRREYDHEYDRRRDRRKEPFEPDLIAVKRAVCGEPPEWLHPSERRLVAEELCAVPLPGRVSLAQAARQMLCTPRHAARLFREIREEEMS